MAAHSSEVAISDNSDEKQRKYFKVTSTKRTAFITKLFSMVSDESTRQLITWSASGDRFIVSNNIEFARLVLPHYFKHCNWASFVRQLNMYDFHKANDSKLAGNNAHYFEFRHPAFNKDAGNKLHKIKRKNPKHRSLPKMKYSNSMDLNTQEDEYQEEEEEEEEEEDEEDSVFYPEAFDQEILEADTTNRSSSNETYDLPRHLYLDSDMEKQRRLENIITSGNTITNSNQLAQQDLNSLMQKTERLEGKIDGLLGHIQQLVGMVNFQGELIAKLLNKIDNNKPEVVSRKPKKIHELLISTSSPEEDNPDRNHPYLQPDSSSKRRKTEKVP